MRTLVFSVAFLFLTITVAAQQATNTDTIFRATANAFDPKNNPFLPYAGKIIRHIRIKNVGFEGDIKDTTKMNGGFGVGIGDALHKNTTRKVIANNLLFKEGDKLNPYLLTDNERYLRDLDYIQDALIIVQPANDAPAVDLLVLVKDGFSIVPSAGIGGTKKYKLGLKEQNLAGTGSLLAASVLYDGNRNPMFGYSGDFLQRNIGGSFINWGLGFKTYNKSFTSGRDEENVYYLRLEKPLASQYLSWFGALDLSNNRTINGYIADAAYNDFNRYEYYNVDGWLGYNIGAKKLLYKNKKSPLRRLVALRGLHQHFSRIPDKESATNDGVFANTLGVLGSVSFFKQNFYRTSYIYGFGRNEDVPQGLTVSLIGGYIRKDSLRLLTKTRPYLGGEFTFGRYTKKEVYGFVNVRVGGYTYKDKWEDVELLVSGDHFTKLQKLSDKWYRRFFFNGSFARQFSNTLNAPLQFISNYGLPYFTLPKDSAYELPKGDMRITSKTEMVFYGTRKYWGFGFAPFTFVDASLIKPKGVAIGKSDIYTGLGAGFRIRNENLLFGTIETRFSYFPRTLPGMNSFKVKFSTNLRYKYNNSLVRRPDFVSPN
ncbi:hypothetical protein QWZ08_21060 [Ferruginibacter paludis]|uniref:hypothetical protein n=1 Tax=Ferruginibacter paludis TaxID=1310417 RepID=UPI0025B455A9|nr:hypothetical protein [Ferruginibacter paludis]MDN3658155.1 hypothetical protein [Ferruginibacter paludis]